MAERDEARESPNVRQLIDRYLEEHATKLAKRNRDDQASMLRKLVEPAGGRARRRRSSPRMLITSCARSPAAQRENEVGTRRRCGRTVSAKFCARCSIWQSAGASDPIIPPQGSPGTRKRPGIAISQLMKSGGCPPRSMPIPIDAPPMRCGCPRRRRRPFDRGTGIQPNTDHQRDSDLRRNMAQSAELRSVASHT